MGHLYDEFYWKLNNFLRYLNKFNSLDVLILKSKINIFFSFSVCLWLFRFSDRLVSLSSVIPSLSITFLSITNVTLSLIESLFPHNYEWFSRK